MNEEKTKEELKKVQQELQEAKNRIEKLNEKKEKPQTPKTQVELTTKQKKQPEKESTVKVHPTNCPFCKAENLGHDKNLEIYKCLECGKYWQK